MLSAHIDVPQGQEGITEGLCVHCTKPFESVPQQNGLVRLIFTGIKDRTKFAEAAHEVSLSPTFADV